MRGPPLTACAEFSNLCARFPDAGIVGLLRRLDSKVDKLDTKVEGLDSKITVAMYAATNVLSAEATAKVNAGAVFYIMNPDTLAPVCCGFFASSRVALTINHDPIFKRAIPFDVPAIDAAGNELTLRVMSTNEAYDFTILRVVGDERPAFFSVPSEAEVGQGNPLGLVSMGIASSARTRTADAEDAAEAARADTGAVASAAGTGAAAAPATKLSTSFHEVIVASTTAIHIVYDGRATTWPADSGALILMHEGTPVAIHLEVFDDRDDEPVGSKRRRVAMSTAFVHKAASGSQSRVCRALRLTCPVVFDALWAAMDLVVREKAAEV